MAACASFAGSLDDIIGAIKVDAAATVTSLLSKGVDVNSSDQQGQSLLMLTARDGREAAFKTLLEHGPDVNAQNRFGETALMLAGL
ncbi:MAG: ankyrin repeat domain-containing protein [Burkholderiales bacterium]